MKMYTNYLEKSVRVGNSHATIVLRCSSEPESEANLRSVRISEIAQKLTEIATFFQRKNKDRLIVRLKERRKKRFKGKLCICK